MQVRKFFFISWKKRSENRVDAMRRIDVKRNELLQHERHSVSLSTKSGRNHLMCVRISQHGLRRGGEKPVGIIMYD